MEEKPPILPPKALIVKVVEQETNGHCAYQSSSTFDTASTTGIGSGPPGEVGVRAVRTSTPSAVTKRVCSVNSQYQVWILEGGK